MESLRRGRLPRLAGGISGAANIVMPSERSAFVDVVLATSANHRSCRLRLLVAFLPTLCRPPCSGSARQLCLQNVSRNSVVALHHSAHVDCAGPNGAFNFSPATLLNATCSRTQLGKQSSVRFVRLPEKPLYTYVLGKANAAFVCAVVGNGSHYAEGVIGLAVVVEDGSATPHPDQFLHTWRLAAKRVPSTSHAAVVFLAVGIWVLRLRSCAAFTTMPFLPSPSSFQKERESLLPL